MEIAVGLESSNEKILKLCINKGLTLKDFEKYARIIQSVVNLRVYLLIKPPFITELEAIDDAVESTRYLQKKINPSTIHFEPCTIQRYALTYYLWKQGHYRLPWLWSIIEIINQIDYIKNIYISPFKHIPKPDFIPHNCGSCDEKVISTIIENFNFTHDKTIFKDLDCECIHDWREDLKYDRIPIQKRILQIIKQINIV